MYKNNIKLFAKNEKELETLTQAVRMYREDEGIEFAKEKCVMLIMKSGKRHLMEETEQPNQDKIRNGDQQILGDIGSRHN